MDSTKKPSAKCTDDVFRRSSSVLSFISMLLIVALFLRMETINKRMKMNELRISDVEIHMKIAVSPRKADNEDEMETSMSKYTEDYLRILTAQIQCYKMTVSPVQFSDVENFSFDSVVILYIN